MIVAIFLLGFLVGSIFTRLFFNNLINKGKQAIKREMGEMGRF